MPVTGIWAVVPSKPLGLAKRRLAPLLAPEERSLLAKAMLQDVLATLRSVSGLSGTLLVTKDSAAIDLAGRADARVLTDRADRSIGAAVAAAAKFLSAEGASGILVVPADLPLATAPEIEAVLDAHGSAPAVTLVRAAIDGGTNALACSPVQAIPLRFGRNSFARHRQVARDSGIEPRMLALPGLQYDIDRPGDLMMLFDRSLPTRTHAYLHGSGIAARLQGELACGTADAMQPVTFRS